jgi:hypothetical protein
MANMTDTELEVIIDKYKKKYLHQKNNWVNICKTRKSTDITVAINDFCAKVFRNGHLNHRTKEEMCNFEKMLLSILDKITAAKTFQDLLDVISSKKVAGIGDLTLYDMALLLASCKGFDLDTEPCFVYAHAGQAQRLRTVCGFETTEEKYAIKDLPVPFQKSGLSPAQLENLFCTYLKD